MSATRRPLVLLILDGWGIAPEGRGNAVACADMAAVKELFARWPHTELACSGLDVGLPRGFMGNSEVGHMNIGAGRVVYQDMTRIDLSIEDGSFYENPAFLDAIAKAKTSGGRLHLMGLLSDGGVHSHVEHLFALLRLAKCEGVEALVHCFMDGRDTAPRAGRGYMQRLLEFMVREGAGSVASVCGRFYAMDRDKRFERVQKAYEMLVQGVGERAPDALSAIDRAYAADQSDEFIPPTPIAAEGQEPQCLRDGDALIFFNFRADRAREISQSIFDPNFEGFARATRPLLSAFASMTRYEASFPLAVAFGPQDVRSTLGEVAAGAGLRQLRIAETEKYAHVTFFLNCGREEPFPGEERILVPSPREVATYDLKPEMSALEVTRRLIEDLDKYDLVVCNLANLDMVGHTGILEAAVAACRVVDGCVDRIAQAVLARGGCLLLTADHGNSEEMIGPDGGPQTAHSVNPVPFLLAGEGFTTARLRAGGRLADIAPTALAILGLAQPQAMTGTSLIEKGAA